MKMKDCHKKTWTVASQISDSSIDSGDTVAQLILWDSSDVGEGSWENGKDTFCGSSMHYRLFILAHIKHSRSTTYTLSLAK